MPMDQAIERIREVFPQMTNTDIEREIQRARGNVELAIMAISGRMGDWGFQWHVFSIKH